MPAFGFDHSYARDLPGASIDWKPAPAAAPRLLYLNEPLAEALGLDPASLRGEAGAALFSGNALPTDARPVAQAYAGHQFGGFSPQLGDGRALLIGELIDRDGQRRDVAFKGSGRTPFSRGGDGKAAVGPMLREVLIGEAMHALGIPTTRALAVAATGDAVMRETRLPGAVLTRVAASHLRVGTFQYFAARGDREALQRLLDYAIARHDPALRDDAVPALAFLRAVTARQAALIAQWMNVGFIHGVMNTDNMTISGETIDYGPCAFLEAVDPATVFSSIDRNGRYAYGRQPQMALWNLTRLAEALLPLLAPDGDEPALERAAGQATEVLEAFPDLYAAALLRGQRAKLGLTGVPAVPARPDHVASAAEPLSPTDAPVAQAGDVSRDEAADVALVQAWLALLQAHRVDHTLAWRRLADAADGDEAPLRGLFADPAAPDRWLADWREALPRDRAPATRSAAMRRVNPWIIPRNHRVEEALAAATDGDLAPFERLLDAVQRPWEETPALATYAEPAAAEATACYRTFCGT